MKILFSKDTGAGSGNDEEKITLTKQEHDKLVNDSEELVKLKENSSIKDDKLTELESLINKLKTERDSALNGLKELEEGIRKEYLDKLSDEHKKIAGLIPGIDGLKEYVKLYTAKPPAGSDAGRPGGSAAEISSKWDDLTYDEKEELRKKRPELWRKMYREKFGFN